MAASTPLTVFIPHTVINNLNRSALTFGYLKVCKDAFLINITALFECDNILEALLKLNVVVCQKHKFQLLGLVYLSTVKNEFNIKLFKEIQDIKLIIRINKISGSSHFEYGNVHKTSSFDTRIIIYDCRSIAKSQLLPLTKSIQNCNISKESFTSFLIETCHSFMDCSRNCHYYSTNIFDKESSTQFNDGLFIHFMSSVQLMILFAIVNFYKCIALIFQWWPTCLTKVITMSALGQQFHQRYIHCSVLYNDHIARIPLTVKSKNLIFAILIDLLCGCLVTSAFLNTDIPDLMLDYAIYYTDDIVSSLTNLINWLMGAPAGLKLNIPLNNALGKFFLYHIYLWESYMMVVQPLFVFILKIWTVIGVFGLTFVLSLLNDLVSLATIHIYCFYGYATRLYGYQVMSLSALWRLFRGKKWNPLRQRIDSYTYDVHQLYLGTLLFTVLLFLLPTVMVYYFVFTCLRLLVLIFHGILSRLINILTICPAYCVVSRILNSTETTGDVYFSVYNAEGDLTLSMQASQISLQRVIQLTLPHLEKYKELLTWKELLSSIVWGKIVYPL